MEGEEVQDEVEEEVDSLTSEHLSSRHGGLLQVSPLLREYCAESLLSREEEQQLFQSLALLRRSALEVMVAAPGVVEGMMPLLEAAAAGTTAQNRLGTQLRGLASNGLLSEPLTTEQYLQQIETQMELHLEQIRSAVDREQRVALVADIVLHPTLWERVEALYQKSGAGDAQNRRLQRLLRTIQGQKERLVRHNLRLVIKHAAVYARHHHDIHDLIQEGTLGLMKAADLFDYRRGYKFSTYASRWILQTILNLLNEITYTIQVPNHISQVYRNVNGYIDQEVNRHGREPTPAKIAQALKMKERDVQRVLRSSWVTSSLHTPAGEEGESGELIDGVAEPEDAYEKVDLFLQYRVLLGAIERVPSERDRDILRRRYAIGYEESTLVDIAAVHGLTKERVRQIINQRLKEIRADLEGAPPSPQPSPSGRGLG